MAENYYTGADTDPAYRRFSRMSGRAIFAGVVVALALQAMFTVLGAAIGLSAFEPTAEAARGVGIGFAIWLILTLSVSAFLGAWVASLFARTTYRRDGFLHGAVVWGTCTLVGLLLLGSSVMGLTSRALDIGSQQAATQPNLQQQAGQVAGTLGGQQGAQAAERAASGTAIGMWGLFLAHLLPLGAALAGGTLGARAEDRYERRAVEGRRAPVGPPVPQPT